MIAPISVFSPASVPASKTTAREKQPYSFGPVEHPFPVVDAKFMGNCSAQCSTILTYGDGRVDLVRNAGRCTIAGVGTPSFCTADVDRNGNVGIEDFLLVLGQWGCQ